MTEDVIFNEIYNRSDKKKAVGMITLNRPKLLNALTRDMFIAIAQHLKTWENSDHIQAVMIEGTGERAFCAGGDIRSLYENRDYFKLQPQTSLPSENEQIPQSVNKTSPEPPFFKNEYQVNHTIYHYPKPFIALLNGITMGGGAGLSIPGRWRIATERLTFAMPETKIGFFPDVGMGYFLAHLPFRIGFYLGLTGESITTADALVLGLVDAITPSEHFSLFRQKLIDTVMLHPKDAAIFDLLTLHKASASQFSPPQLIKKAALIEHHFKAHTIEALIHSLSNSQDPWCQATAHTLLQRSPTSLKVTLKHLQHCEKMTFGEVIAEDGKLANHFLQQHDFFEGIRALLIDKDQQPDWQPKSIAEVSTDFVNQFFVD